MLSTIYFVRVSMPPEKVADLSGWYKARHAADLINVGFLAVHHHVAVEASAQVCNVYEIEGVSVFGERYENSQKSDDHLQTTIAPSSDLGTGVSTQTIYSQIGLCNVPDSARTGDRASLAQSLTAPVICTVLFDSAQSPGALTTWFESEEAVRLTALPGFVRSRLLSRDAAQHPGAIHGTEPVAYGVISEWANVDAGRKQLGSAGAGLEAIGSKPDSPPELFRNDLTVRHAEAWAP